MKMIPAVTVSKQKRGMCVFGIWGKKTGNTILKIKRTGEITQDKSRKVYE